MTSHRTATALVLLGWALLYSRHGDGWRAVDTFRQQWQCERVRDARIDGETDREIGGALAVQAPDNPMRQAAYERAYGHVRGRYRCERDD